MGTDLADWVEQALGHRPRDAALFERALTHGSRTDSHGSANYQRLEFLGDRVLGLVIAGWLYDEFPDEPEGELTKRFNALVTGAVCAEVAREIGAAERIRLNKQGRGDGVQHRETVLGDVTEALLGAIYREGGLAAAEPVVRRLWAGRIRAAVAVPQHPKSALQEWAAAHRRAAPAYSVVARSGPDHAPQLTVRVAVGKDEAIAVAGSKQAAEIAAARVLLEQLSGGLPPPGPAHTEVGESDHPTHVRPEPVEGPPARAGKRAT